MDDIKEKDQNFLSIDHITNRISLISDFLWDLKSDDDGKVDLTVYAAKGASHILIDINGQINDYRKLCKILFEERKK